GWMLMAEPLLVGHLLSCLANARREMRTDWRSRLVWLSTSGAAEIILIAFAISVMALSVTMTMSSSGLASLIVALSLLGWVVTRRRRGPRSAIVLPYLLLIVIGAVWWTGFNHLVARFSSTESVDFQSRWLIWRDALQVARAFPLLGTGMNTF